MRIEFSNVSISVWKLWRLSDIMQIWILFVDENSNLYWKLDFPYECEWYETNSIPKPVFRFAFFVHSYKTTAIRCKANLSLFKFRLKIYLLTLKMCYLCCSVFSLVGFTTELKKREKERLFSTVHASWKSLRSMRILHSVHKHAHKKCTHYLVFVYLRSLKLVDLFSEVQPWPSLMCSYVNGPIFSF